MNILLITSTLDTSSGWGNICYNIVKAMREIDKNINFTIFTSENKKLRFGFNTLKSEYYVGRKLYFLYLLFDLINILIKKGKRKYDLIHIMIEQYAVIGFILSTLLRTPYILTVYGTYAVKLPCNHKLFKKSFENANKIISISNYTKKRMIEEKIRAYMEVITLGTDKNRFYFDENVKKTNTILFVGNLKRRKGLLFLLKTLKEVNKKNNSIKLLIIGKINKNTPTFSKVNNFIQKNNLNVEFLGHIRNRNLFKYYQKAKLNILPSRSERFFFEGFGLVHLEANACGTLTIGTYNSGNEDAIQPGNGYIIRYGDIDELKNIILNVFENNRYDYPDIGKIRSWRDVAIDYREIYINLIKNRKN